MKADVTVDLALGFDAGYLPGAAVAIASVAAHARPETGLRFHLFTEGVRPESVDFLRTTLRRIHPNGEIVQHVCGETLLKGLPYWAGSRIAAARIFYARLLPDVDWCLHLDCDILYLGSVEAHFAERDESVYACVTTEQGEPTNAEERAWIARNVLCGGRPVEISRERYFNSGVMLLNLKKMRQDNVPEALAQFFKDHPDVPSPDQDALNVVFGGHVKMLPVRYNQSQLTLTDEKLGEGPVIHYVVGIPWLPKLMGVANNRFWLWHACADKWVWQKRGESLRRSFGRKTLILKVLCCWILRSSLGGLFAWTLEKSGRIRDASGWRQSQVGSDISRRAAAEFGRM